MKKVIISAVIGASFLAAGIASAQTYGSCPAISTTLSVGSRNSQVLALQVFLVSQNYPGGGAWMETGYYGTATEAAVRDFQQARGLPQTGVVDATTLSALENCNNTSSSYTYPGYPAYTTGTTYPYTTSPYTTTPYTTYPYTYGYSAPTITSLSQNTGSAGQTVVIYGQGFEPTNTVYFNGEAIPANSNGSTQITFTIPYTNSYSANQSAQLYVTNQDGTSNTVSFTLNPNGYTSGCGTEYGYSYSNCGCSNTYAYTSSCSTCGYTYQTYPYTYGCQGNTSSPTVTYLSPTSGGVGTNVTVYGSGFTTSNNTVHFGNGVITGILSPDGQSVSFVVPSQLTGYGSQPVTLSTYEVSVTNSNNITSNAVPFTVTSTVSGNGAPTITSVSGPTNVQTGVTETWTVTISNPNSNYTTVSAYWGDTGNGYVNQAAPQTVYSGIQTVTFTHAYETVGTYTLTFTVSNQNGQTNSYTSSITVSGNGYGNGTPTISYLTPTSGYVGSQVTIYGSNFGANGNNNTIYFGSGAIQNVYSNGNSITFTVPSYVTPYCASGTACPQYAQEITPGTYNVSVMDQYGTSNEVSFTVL